MNVVIIGAGPAGMISGLMLAEQGIQPLILEKQPVIQSTACAEGCDFMSLSKLSFDTIPYVENNTVGARIIFPGNNYLTTHIPGVVLNRTAWLKGMANSFCQQGGKLRLNARVVTITDNAVQLGNGERIPFEVLIGADGPFSVLRKYMGIPQKLICGVQYKLEHDSSDKFLHFYFDKRFSSHYSWVFPKQSTLNVGLAGKFCQLDSFVEHLKLNDCSIVKREAGAIPVSGVPRNIIKGRMALIGDAASMTNAISGGGLGPIIYAGHMLAKNITNLAAYQQEIHRHPLANPAIVRGEKVLASITNPELEKIGSLFNCMDLRNVRRRDLARILKYPHLISKFIRLGRSVQLTLRWGW